VIKIKLIFKFRILFLINRSRLLSNHSAIFIQRKKERRNKYSSLSSPIDVVFPSDWGTYDDLACHKLFHFSPLFIYSFWDMFKNTFQSGFLSILYSIGSKPLQIWDKKVYFKDNKNKTCIFICLRYVMDISKE
jgi:hypothetical protein